MHASALSLTGPRERLVDVGVEALADAELLALLLGTGSPSESVEVLAARLLHEQGGVDGLAHAGVGELAARRGLGIAKGARIAAAIELGRRVARASGRLTSIRLPDCRAVDAWARSRLATLDHEELWVLALDGNNRLRAARCVARGGLHGMHVAVRDPLRVALREGASAFVLVHNHPSGDSTPSREDIAFTASIAAAADVVSTPLVDHVIVASHGFTSMLERQLLPPSAQVKPSR
jgi:DNA repair protein RadC